MSRFKVMVKTLVSLAYSLHSGSMWFIQPKKSESYLPRCPPSLTLFSPKILPTNVIFELFAFHEAHSVREFQEPQRLVLFQPWEAAKSYQKVPLIHKLLPSTRTGGAFGVCLLICTTRCSKYETD